jgi:hypothetical protein
MPRVLPNTVRPSRAARLPAHRSIARDRERRRTHVRGSTSATRGEPADDVGHRAPDEARMILAGVRARLDRGRAGSDSLDDAGDRRGCNDHVSEPLKNQRRRSAGNPTRLIGDEGGRPRFKVGARRLERAGGGVLKERRLGPSGAGNSGLLATCSRVYDAACVHPRSAPRCASVAPTRRSFQGDVGPRRSTPRSAWASGADRCAHREDPPLSDCHRRTQPTRVL